MTKKKEAHCDFCYALDPPLVWQVANGGAVECFGVKDDGDPTKLVSDSDGLWAACNNCDEQIRKFHAGKRDASAVRRFARSTWDRSTTELLSKVPKHQRKRAAKAIQEQQYSLFSELLPQLGNPRPVSVVEKAPPSLMSLSGSNPGLTPTNIPDGSTRTRRIG
jgi:hypothetical protein